MILRIAAFGRPAPQGSHNLGGAGQFLDASPYLAAWRQAVKVATYRAYEAAAVDFRALPLYPAGTPVVVESCVFYVADDQCRSAGRDETTGKPDIDKLLRAVLDALGGAPGSARLFADDSQVVEIRDLRKTRRAPGERTGAMIVISDGREQQ